MLLYPKQEDTGEHPSCFHTRSGPIMKHHDGELGPGNASSGMEGRWHLIGRFVFKASTKQIWAATHFRRRGHHKDDQDVAEGLSHLISEDLTMKHPCLVEHAA